MPSINKIYIYIYALLHRNVIDFCRIGLVRRAFSSPYLDQFCLKLKWDITTWNHLFSSVAFNTDFFSKIPKFDVLPSTILILQSDIIHRVIHSVRLFYVVQKIYNILLNIHFLFLFLVHLRLYRSSWFQDSLRYRLDMENLLYHRESRWYLYRSVTISTFDWPIECT